MLKLGYAGGLQGFKKCGGSILMYPHLSNWPGRASILMIERGWKMKEHVS